MHILIVEDERKTREYLQKGLGESGYVVDTAADGVDGLHLALTTARGWSVQADGSRTEPLRP